MKKVVSLRPEDNAPTMDTNEESFVIPEGIRLRALREMRGVHRVLGKIDTDYLAYQDRKRLESAVGRLEDLETVFGPPTVQVTPGMRLAKRDKLVLVHIRRRGRVLRSALLVALSRYRISAADLTASITTLVHAGIVAEHRELASNGHVKTTYSIAPSKDP
jgi:hypothetical protein